MKHRKNYRKLNRKPSHRKAMVQNLVASLFEHGRVVTTMAKAKEARRLAEPLITLAKKGTLAARRRALAELGDRKLVAGLFNTLGPRYAKRPGGYTRIIPWKNRLGDKALKVYFELVEEEIGARKKPKRKKKIQRKTKKELESASKQETAAKAQEPAAKAEDQNPKSGSGETGEGAAEKKS